MTHVKLEFPLRRLTSSILSLKFVGELEFVSCEPHTYSSIPPHTALLHSFVRPPAGSSVELRCVRRSEVFITHAAVSTALAHSSMCVPPLTPSSQSLLHYTCTLARTLIDRTHFAIYPVTVHTDLFIFIMIYFSVFWFGINRSLCCTAFFTLDEPSKWSGDLQTTKSRNNNTEKVCHPIVFARDYRI